MSIRIYLNESIRKNPQFFVRANDNGPTPYWINKELGVDSGQLYWWSMDDNKPQISEELALHMSRVTLKETYWGVTHREAGVYRHGVASATVESDWGSDKKKWWLIVDVVSDNVDDAFELLHQIKVGSIRPEESFERPQITREEFEKQAPKFVPVLPPAGDPGFLRPKVTF